MENKEEQNGHICSGIIQNYRGRFGIHTSEADLSESLWLDCASSFALALPIAYVQATIFYPIYRVATTLRDTTQTTTSLAIAAN